MSRSALRGASTLPQGHSGRDAQPDKLSPDVEAVVAAYKARGNYITPRQAEKVLARMARTANCAEDARVTRLDPLDPRVKVISWSDDTGERGAKHADGDLIWESEATRSIDRERKAA